MGQLHFKGDSIDRPPTSREWAWLMRRLVALSKWANAKLGLDKLPDDDEIAETLIKVGSMCLCTCWYQDCTDLQSLVEFSEGRQNPAEALSRV